MEPNYGTWIFEVLSRQPDLVNECANRIFSTEPKIKFSSVFPTFFDLNSNTLSWIEVFSRYFAIDRVRNDVLKDWLQSPEGQDVRQIVYSMFTQFKNLGYEKVYRVFELYVCLFYIYKLLVQQNYRRNDKPFSFMAGFPVQATRVVILGNDPAGRVDSSGYSFHGSNCPSTTELICLINSDMQVLSEYLDVSFQMTDDELENEKANCNLQGLINQGVLFMNVKLTPDKEDRLKGAWEILTDFLLKYLSTQPTPIVFILAGNVAAGKSKLIDHSTNFCMCVYHPSFYCYGYPPKFTLDWAYNVPLINANAVIFQTIGKQYMIDWSDVSGTKPGKEQRLDSLARVFSNILCNPGNHPFADYSLNIKEDLRRFYFLKATCTVDTELPPPVA